MEPIEGEDKKSTYQRMFTEIIDVMVSKVSDRFCGVPKLKFSFHLLNAEQFANYQQDSPVEALNCLTENFGRCLDAQCLESELVALCCGAGFHKNVSELHEYMYQAARTGRCVPSHLPVC
jgi:hypothetical protein